MTKPNTPSKRMTGSTSASAASNNNSDSNNNNNDSPSSVGRRLFSSVSSPAAYKKTIWNEIIPEDYGDRSGFMYKKRRTMLRSSWQPLFFILTNGSLYIYDNYKDHAPKGVIHLKNCTIYEKPTLNTKRRFVFLIHTALNNDLYFDAKDQQDKDEWIKAICNNMNKSPSPPPDKEFIKKKKGIMGQMQSKLVDAAARFGPSKKVILEFMTDDTIDLLECIKSFITKYDSKEKADLYEKRLISLGCKIGLLYKDKKITAEYFVQCKEKTHRMCDKLIDAYELPSLFNSHDIADSIHQVQAEFQQILSPYLSDKTLGKMNDLFDYLSNEALLREFFAKRKHPECAQMGEILRRLWDEQLV